MQTEKTPIEQMIDIFTEATGLPWPKHFGGDKPEKWLDPLKAISQATGDTPEMRERAIIEAVKECRNRDILISSPNSIMSTALHLISQWTKAGNGRNNPTEGEFVAYRNRAISLGYNVKW